MMKQPRYNEQVQIAQGGVVGVGPTTSALFAVEIGDISRFKGFDQLNNYMRVCPDTHSSGETERDTGITTRRHKQLPYSFNRSSLAGETDESDIAECLPATYQKDDR